MSIVRSGWVFTDIFLLIPFSISFLNHVIDTIRFFSAHYYFFNPQSLSMIPCNVSLSIISCLYFCDSSLCMNVLLSFHLHFLPFFHIMLFQMHGTFVCLPVYLSVSLCVYLSFSCLVSGYLSLSLSLSLSL